MCTTGPQIKITIFCSRSVFVCLIWISKQTAIISLSKISWSVFTTETGCVHCAVRTDTLNVILIVFPFKGLIVWNYQFRSQNLFMLFFYEFHNKQRMFLQIQLISVLWELKAGFFNIVKISFMTRKISWPCGLCYFIMVWVCQWKYEQTYWTARRNFAIVEVCFIICRYRT